jgi:hypothetical protein
MHYVKLFINQLLLLLSFVPSYTQSLHDSIIIHSLRQRLEVSLHKVVIHERLKYYIYSINMDLQTGLLSQGSA